ncbi:hypothetical protein AMELA_G00172950 [Ameiurus melas]|uniref:Uncharacterized protein n=1 Tax=Ameiurus melas TaxID=219545 RepID=A0A7J6ACA7_AMEME|nr:hypothetical protein AMELA_G00172950 [Ameiurus melas]
MVLKTFPNVGTFQFTSWFREASRCSLFDAHRAEVGLRIWASAADVLKMALQNGLKMMAPSCFCTLAMFNGEHPLINMRLGFHQDGDFCTLTAKDCYGSCSRARGASDVLFLQRYS